MKVVSADAQAENMASRQSENARRITGAEWPSL